MTIDVQRVGAEGERFAGEEPIALLDGEGEPGLRPGGAIRYRLGAQVVSGRLMVSGALSMDNSFLCSRCVEWFLREIREPAFSSVHEIVSGQEIVDLTPEMREAMLLSLPAHPLCREDCRGLCSRCGANRNRGACGCGPAPEFRWEALGRLKGP